MEYHKMFGEEEPVYNRRVMESAQQVGRMSIQWTTYVFHENDQCDEPIEVRYAPIALVTVRLFNKYPRLYLLTCQWF
ncbi:hypothetical protein HanPSC8_Chr14g0600771 [Helianthus annuus]|nr:hypothetical protein HanPSC8_Chr14g0600771 [Helianthus annuus]